MKTNQDHTHNPFVEKFKGTTNYNFAVFGVKVLGCFLLVMAAIGLPIAFIEEIKWPYAAFFVVVLFLGALVEISFFYQMFKYRKFKPV